MTWHSDGKWEDVNPEGNSQKVRNAPTGKTYSGAQCAAATGCDLF